ncbi:MAG TPA: hypothetical protein VJB70_05195 [Candidatus Paceibacterota bacterium]
MKKLLDKDLLDDLFQIMTRAKLGPPSTIDNDAGVSVSNFFKLSVNYDKKYETMISAGHYDRWPFTIFPEEHILMSGNGVLEFDACLLQLHHSTYSLKRAVAKIQNRDLNGWTPARVEHLLAFGKRFPKEQLYRPIIGTGTVVFFLDDATNKYDETQEYNVPSLHTQDGDKVTFGSTWWLNETDFGHYRFLVVKNNSQNESACIHFTKVHNHNRENVEKTKIRMGTSKSGEK